MAAPSAELLRLVKGGQFHTGGNPVLRWCASNVVLQADPAGNLKPDKQRSSEKIDGVVAICNALGVALVVPAEKAAVESVYNQRAAGGEPVIRFLGGV